MRYMATYDLMETMRNTNQWLGATALAMGSYPITGLFPNPYFQMIAGWGEVTERTFARMVAKPDWGISSMVAEDGRDHVVEVQTIVKRAFGDLIHFKVLGRKERTRRVLLVAPMSGHYATLLRSTVISLLPDAEVYITDWHNARDIPVSEGKFDIEDYTQYLIEFMRALGHTCHVIAVCQPAPLALAATAYLAEHDPIVQPRTLTLIGGPIDPEANHTDVTDFGRTVTMGQLEELALQRVGFKYAGAGRMVYPGLLQLAGFMSMNAERHLKAFADQIIAVSKGEAGDHDKHNRFYDEYLAVMDMTAEFYLSTVDRIFKSREIARNDFTVDGTKIDFGKITDVAVKVVEGEDDDISAPGQCLAALKLLTGLPDDKKASHLEPGAGHYGIFAGKSWRNNIRPLVLDFIDGNAAPDQISSKRKAVKAKAPAKPAAASKPQTKAKPKAVAKPATAPKPETEAKPKAAVKPRARKTPVRKANGAEAASQSPDVPASEDGQLPI
ncbi:MAG: polyhydroxyalkanoate depolymerase [Rhodobacter sp.]|nr:polyhydroxyalkanoate depolymerase [Rhodobacter sp.]